MRRLLVALLFATACALPNPDDIDLSGCLRLCKVDSESCLDEALKHAEECANNDRECIDEGSRRFAACLTGALDCAATCAEEAEDALK